MDDVISLGIGDPYFLSPKAVLDGARESMEKGLTGYTSNAGIRELRDAISAQIQRLYGVTYDPASE
ncbi:MAG: pyridoxal phosphate-dependent aminotransferase, partial [Rhodothermales bacterium]|nr:pyridoxal phosphate-dependent aminotransferase [Rhodothermales bacterium]